MRPAKPLLAQPPFVLVFLEDIITFTEGLESHIASLVIREMQVKITVRYTGPSLKSLQLTNSEEDVKKSEISYTVGGNVNWCNHYGDQNRGSSKNQK